ncbi:MAG: hypothetical protein JW847_00395 [Candidatus Omnitrophica bacterium]|nr:hypothetical protein [Candidatus Omnitrophota bacterium]
MNKKELVREYIRKHRYFTLSQIARETGLGRKILWDYLSQLKTQKVIFDAGYGCYSLVGKVFELPKVDRAQDIVQFVKKEFPLLTDFIVWDTRGLRSFYHHIQTHHITFVEVEKDILPSVFDKLYLKFRNVLRERRSKVFFESFDVTRNPVVVRGLVSRSPWFDHVPALEKILIDMFMDLDKYNYIGRSDYLEIWRELIQEYRIDMRVVYSYSKRRKCLEGLLSQLIDIHNSYGIEVYQLLREVGKPL